MDKQSEDFILQHYKDMTKKKMSEVLGVTVPRIQYFLKTKNLIEPKLKFSDEDIEYLKQHYHDMEYKDIAKELGYTERQVRGKINNLGLTKLRKINTHYFSEINTPLKAYFLGFIYADGWIICKPQTRNYELGMQLQSSDKYILELLNKELGGQNIIYHQDGEDKVICGVPTHSGPAEVLRVYSKDIVNDLIRHGVTTNKTLKETHPVVRDEFFFDFLRGYIDGDGCYFKCGGRINMHITCATDAVLKYIQNALSQYNIKMKIHKEKDRKYRLTCTSAASMSILIPLMYHDRNLICLSRKYDIIKSYLGSAA